MNKDGQLSFSEQLREQQEEEITKLKKENEVLKDEQKEQKERLAKIIMEIENINEDNTDKLKIYKEYAYDGGNDYCEIYAKFDYYDCEKVVDKNREIDSLLGEIGSILGL